MKKYDPKQQAAFSDPVVRCDSCQALILREKIQKFGSCHKCGNKRIRNVTVFDKKELKQMKKWGVDPAFLALFEGVEDE